MGLCHLSGGEIASPMAHSLAVADLRARQIRISPMQGDFRAR
jgi:hypothetical protein